MKVEVRGKQLRFIEYDKKEFAKLNDLLTWENSYLKQFGKEVKDTLLFYDEEGFFTFFGIVDLISSKFKEFEVVIDDRDSDLELVDVSPDIFNNITLRDYQVSSIRKSVILKRGIIELPTGSGKSNILLGICKVLIDLKDIKRSLIILPSVPIMSQFYISALECGFLSNQLGKVFAGEKSTNKQIVFAVINSLAQGLDKNNEVIIDLVKNSDFIAFDEAHHSSSVSFLKVAYNSEAEWMIGASGTPFKNRDKILDSINDTIIYGLVGKPIIRITQKLLVDRGIIADTVIFMKPTGGLMKKYRAQYTKIYKREVVDNLQRNKVIVDYCNRFYKSGLSVLVSVNVKDHAMYLLKQLHDKYPLIKAICMFGGSEATLFENNLLESYSVNYDVFSSDFEDGKYDVIIATQTFDEGVNLPSVGALILAGAGKSIRQVRQRLGRGVRSKKTGRNEVFVLDFFDKGHIFMYSQSRKRMNIYLEEVESDIIEREDEFISLINSCRE